MPQPLVVIVGRPNVGKSTLFNRIIGRRRALVRDEPGITRDRQYAKADWDGFHFRIADTGGLEFAAKTKLQKKVSDQAFKSIEDADLIILLMDGRAGITTLDREWVQQVRLINKPKLFVINKIDAAKEEPLLSDFYELGLPDLVPASAEMGRGVADLMDRIKNDLCKIKGWVAEAGAPKFASSGRSQAMPNLGEPKAGPIPPFRLALIGRPNVGKSTLLNCLLNEERSIVDDVPGTTRDPVDTHLTINGNSYSIIDTAGIRKRGKTNEVIEKFSVIKSIRVIEKSDICLLLLDSNEDITEQDEHVAGEAFKLSKGIIVLVNKWDEGEKKYGQKDYRAFLERRLHFISHSPVLFISAKSGKGVEKIFPTIERYRKQFEMELPQKELRETFAELVAAQPSPVFRGKNIGVFSIKQVGVRPPTFVIQTNEPTKIHFSYERYLSNALREAFGLKEVPVRLVFRKV